MHDQADQLRRLVREAIDVRGDLAPGAPLIAVSGAQPRLGATTIACGLARELASLGKQVTLVDANLAAPAIAEQFEATPYGTLAEVLVGSRRAIEVLTPVADNIHILAGDAEPASAPLDAEAFAHLYAELAALSRQCDVVIIDAGAGMNPWVDRLWQLASQTLLVTTPAAPAVLDAYTALKLSDHERAAAKLQLVVTRCDAAADAARIHGGFSATSERFLGHAIRPPAVLPTITATGDAFQRSVRVLAADLACDLRALALRVPRNAIVRTPALGASRVTNAPPQPPHSPRSLTGG
jgi:MinD-like ATPase involved in chromosome partitioning or flagellar assembly